MPEVAGLPCVFEVPWRNDATGEISLTETIAVYANDDAPPCIEVGNWSQPILLGPGLVLRTRVQ